MSAPEAVVYDWSRCIKRIWAERLTPIASRERGDAHLPDAWRRAADAARTQEWELRAMVPLLQDPHDHRWAVVLERGEASYPSPNLVFVHGDTPALALARTVALLEQGVEQLA